VASLLGDELELEPDTMRLVQLGLLLALQLDPSGDTDTLLFGHQSFREFLVAHFWRHQLLRIIDARRNERAEIEKRLMKGRLLQDDDRSFDFLSSMLQRLEPEQRRALEAP